MSTRQQLNLKHLECIKEDNSSRENERQWRRSKIVFEHFYEYLRKKGVVETQARSRTEKAIFFIMDYCFVYEDVESILDVSGDTIRRFLGNWYIRKFINLTFGGIKANLNSIPYFFTFLKDRGFISKEKLAEIKVVCRDKAWFEMRLKSYLEAEDDDFPCWIKEHNYD
jgi:hypothetical protein